MERFISQNQSSILSPPGCLSTANFANLGTFTFFLPFLTTCMTVKPDITTTIIMTVSDDKLRFSNGLFELFLSPPGLSGSTSFSFLISNELTDAADIGVHYPKSLIV